MEVKKKVLSSIKKIIKQDKKNMFYLFYYSVIEAILVLSIPLTTSFIINSVLSHASISVIVLGFIIIVIFILTIFLQIIKEYIVEKFQQKIFVTTAIEISEIAIHLKGYHPEKQDSIDKYMNYFFDISAIQKFFPIFLLDGTGLVVKVVVSLLLLLAFDPLFFGLGLLFFFLFIGLLYLSGHNGIQHAITRSDAKHDAIFFLQTIPNRKESQEKTLEKLNAYLTSFIDARENIFKVIMRQLSLTFIMEGLIITTFLIGGSYLVINGTLPLGEFVAAEIVIVAIVYTLKAFMKHLDYIYDMIEGFYKVNKLSTSLEDDKDVQ